MLHDVAAQPGISKTDLQF